MEKKGNILTQLALISDLFERANMESQETSATLIVEVSEFERLFKLFSRKAHTKLVVINDTFTVKIGIVKYVFSLNKSNV